MDNDRTISVSVVVALVDEQRIVELVLPVGSTIADALEAADVGRVDEANIGVYGQHRRLAETLHEGDRVEIYRDLLDDPKRIRRRRAQLAKQRR